MNGPEEHLKWITSSGLDLAERKEVVLTGDARLRRS